MRRILTSFLPLAILLSLVGPARAERTLQGEVALALSEATTIENTIGAGVLRGTPQAKLLRRGKKSLQKALDKHQAGKSKAAFGFFARGLGQLNKAFRDEDPAGQHALDGILDELTEWVTVRVPQVRAEFDLYEDLGPTRAGLKFVDAAFSAVDKFERSIEFSTRSQLGLTAYLYLAKAEKKLLRVKQASRSGPCILTDPSIVSIGGGWWEVRIDGAAPVRMKGETFADAFDDVDREFSLNSDQHAAPFITFDLVGPYVTHKGTYPVQRAPAGETFEQQYEREFVTGFWQDTSWQFSGPRWVFTEGTITIEKVRLGDPKKKRRIEGRFLVTGVSSEDGSTRSFSGRFHLCHFGVARGGNDDGN